jgi:hypothetical protein
MIIEMKKINSNFLTILFVIGCVVFDIIVPQLIIILLAFLLGKFVPQFTYSKLKPEDIPYITTDIRKYYHYSKPFLVTKCFDCTNELFKNKDVFIFIGPNSEIRITVNLLRTYRDLGCYYFNKNEIKCEYIEVDNKIRTLLKVNDKFSFVLGNKAKPFIKKCFTPSPCSCCGSLVFNKAARGMFAICPICNWEDDLEQEKDHTNSDGANNVCLNEARINYKKYGRCETPLDLRCSKPEKDELKE